MATRAGLAPEGWPHTLMAWPAVWSVPLGFLTMVLVSLATPRRVPPGTAALLARLHLPEEFTGLPGESTLAEGNTGAVPTPAQEVRR
jgi:hypothetical protein